MYIYVCIYNIQKNRFNICMNNNLDVRDIRDIRDI